MLLQPNLERKEAIMRRGKQDRTMLIKGIPKNKMLIHEKQLSDSVKNVWKKMKSILRKVVDGDSWHTAIRASVKEAGQNAIIPEITKAEVDKIVEIVSKSYGREIAGLVTIHLNNLLDSVNLQIARQLRLPNRTAEYTRIKNEIMERHFKIVSTQVTETMATDLKNVLTEGITSGLSSSEIIANMNMLEGNHRTIARTEVGSAVNEASFEMTKAEMEHLGMTGITKKGWTTANDEKVRDSHQQAGEDYGEGKEIPIDQPFIVGGKAIMFPGEYAADAPEETINCRCTHYITFSPSVQA